MEYVFRYSLHFLNTTTPFTICSAMNTNVKDVFQRLASRSSGTLRKTDQIDGPSLQYATLVGPEFVRMRPISNAYAITYSGPISGANKEPAYLLELRYCAKYSFLKEDSDLNSLRRILNFITRGASAGLNRLHDDIMCLVER